MTATNPTTMVLCPYCCGAQNVCSVCSQVECNAESMTAEHDAFSEPAPCGICGGAGDVPADFAAVYERRQQERARCNVPQTFTEESDVPF